MRNGPPPFPLRFSTWRSSDSLNCYVNRSPPGGLLHISPSNIHVQYVCDCYFEERPSTDVLYPDETMPLKTDFRIANHFVNRTIIGVTGSRPFFVSIKGSIEANGGMESSSSTIAATASSSHSRVDILCLLPLYHQLYVLVSSFCCFQFVQSAVKGNGSSPAAFVRFVRLTVFYVVVDVVEPVTRSLIRSQLLTCAVSTPMIDEQ